MVRERLEGVVKKIDVLGNDFGFITLILERSKYDEEKNIPVYATLNKEILGKRVYISTIIEEGMFEQSITSPETSYKIVMPYSHVEEINRKYGFI